MAYQFVHIQTYAPKPVKVIGAAAQFNSTEQVFGEAERQAHYSMHVPDPAPPIHLAAFGSIRVGELRKLHDMRRAAIREVVKKPNGETYQRGLKSDFQTLYTEIHSHPMTAADYKTAPKTEKQRVHKWARLALLDFTNRMPDGVKFSAVLHLDEGHVHFHILAVNMNDPKLSANKLHVGKIAAEEWRQRNGPSKTLIGLPKPDPMARPKKPGKPKPSKNRITQKKRDAEHAAALAAWQAACIKVEAHNTAVLKAWETENNAHLRAGRKERKGKAPEVAAYQGALAAFQDRYHAAVGKPCGLLRNGPGTERLSTMQYAARKKQASVMANEEAAHRAAEDSLKDRETAQAAAEAGLVQREVALAERERILTDKCEDFSHKKAAFDQHMLARSGELERREQAVKVQEVEVSEAVAALGDMVEQFEAGDIALGNGSLNLRHHHPFLQRAAMTAPENRSPVQRLVARFVGVLKRAVIALSGGAVTSPEDRPGM